MNSDINVILACDSAFGIGKDNKLPWSSPQELALFREKTMDSVLIVGRKTAESLPILRRRIVLCVSSCDNIKDRNGALVFPSVERALIYANSLGKKIFICGGKRLYEEFLENGKSKRLYISIFRKNFNCDTFIKFSFYFWKIIEKIDYEDFVYYEAVPNHTGEKDYLKLLQATLECEKRASRNGFVFSDFGKQLEFNLENGFPLLTTKKMFFRGIVEELLFFLRGETNSKILEEKGVNIWKPNTDRAFLDMNGFRDRAEGIMGPLYGFMWRYYGAEYDEKTGKPVSGGIDQLAEVINAIRNDPGSRRIIMTDYDPSKAKQGVLYPCHSIILQFYVSGKYIDMYCYNRSQDLFLGTPFNIASSALLICIIGKITRLTPRRLIMGLGDVHIYEEHISVVKEQLERGAFDFPRLEILGKCESIQDIEGLRYEDFYLENYRCHSALKSKMIA
jgi:dihydrofolate reductase/thymidylate synthase